MKIRKPILFALILCGILFVINLSTFAITGFFTDNGYVVTSDLKKDILTPDETIKLQYVSKNDEIYSRIDGKFTKNEKVKYSEQYPLYLQDGQSVLFFNADSSLISNEFDVLETYEGLYLTNGSSYNSDMSRADEDEFIFAKLPTGEVIFAQQAELKTVYGSFRIPVNSIAMLGRDKINYGVFQNGFFSTKVVEALNDAILIIGDNEYNYVELFSLLSSVDTKDKNEDQIKEISKPEESIQPTSSSEATMIPEDEGTDTEGSTTPTSNPDSNNGNNTDLGNSDEGIFNDPFIKPIVTLNRELKPWVYSVKGSLEIQDSSNSLYRGVQVYIRYAGSDRLYMRKTVKKSGEFSIGILQPDTEFDLTVGYKYRLPNKEKIDVVVNDKPIKFETLPRSELEPLHFTMTEEDVDSKIYISNQVSIQGMKFVLDENENETMKYVSRAVFDFTNDNQSTINLSMNQGTLKQLTQGNEVEWITTNSLSSNSNYIYNIKFFDSFNEPLPTTVDSKLSGTSRTSKKMPKSSLNISSTAVGDVKLNLKLENIDNAVLGDTKFYITKLNSSEKIYLNYEINGVRAEGSTGLLSLGNNRITISNLRSGENYEIIVESDSIDLEDNQAHENVKLMHEFFYTDSLATLGKVYYEASFSNVKARSADLNLKISARVNKAILPLVSEFTVDLIANHQTEHTIQISKENLSGPIDMNEVYYENQRYNYVLIDDEEYKVIQFASDKNNLEDSWKNILRSADSKLKCGLVIQFKNKSLKSKTDYTMNISTRATQGGVVTDVSSVTDYPLLKTLKEAATTVIANQFTTSDFHEIYDFEVIDKDDAIVGNKLVSMRIYDGQTLIGSKTISPNQKYDKYRFSNLSKDKQYTIDFIAVEYNEGYSSNEIQTYKSLGKYTFNTGDNISGSIKIENTELTLVSSGLGVDEINLARKAIEKGDFYPNKFNRNGKFTDSIGATAIKIEVEPNTEYRMLNYAQTNEIGSTIASFESAENKHLGNQQGQYIQINTLTKGHSVFKTPDNAKYLYVSVASEYTNLVTVYKHDASMCSDQPELFTIENQTLNTFIGDYGAVSVNVNYNTSDFIEIFGGSYYDVEATGEATGIVSQVAFYDKNKNFISVETTLPRGSVISPVNSRYTKISYSKVSDSVSIKLCMETNMNRMNANINVELLDRKNDLIENPKYYLQVYRADLKNRDNEDKYKTYGDLIEYEIDHNDNVTNNVNEFIRLSSLPSNYAYKVELIVKKYGANIVLGSTKFDTEKITSSIRDESDLLRIVIDPSANYIVYSDLVMNRRICAEKQYLMGTLDFNGHTVSASDRRGSFEYIGKTGAVKNLVYNFSNVHEAANAINVFPFAINNQGKISNIIVNLDLKTNENISSYSTMAIVSTNNVTGIIENFVVNNTRKYSSSNGAMFVYYNYGIIRNGWLYGSSIKNAAYTQFKSDSNSYEPKANNDVGLITSINNGTISNIFNQIDLVVGEHQKNSAPTDIYYPAFFLSRQQGVLKDSANFADMYSYNPNIGTGSEETIVNDDYHLIRQSWYGRDTSNLVSFSPKLRSNLTSPHTSKGAVQLLADYKWYDTNFNSLGGFNTFDMVTAGYYPQVKMDAVMDGKQPFTFLPDYTMVEQDMYLSYVEEQKLNEATLILSITNVNNYQVENVVIDGLDCEVLEQYWDQDNYRVRVKVTNPTKFYSKYSLKSIESSNADGNRVVTQYEANSKFGVKYVEPEFYDTISSPSEWSKLRANTTQNYRLMSDIDFSGFTDYKNQVYVKDTFTGKLDGSILSENEEVIGFYALNNIKCTGDLNRLFLKVTGTISNVIISNFESNSNSNTASAVFENTDSAIFDNVHLRDSRFTSANKVGLISNAIKTTIQNSSVVNSQFYLKENPTVTYTTYAGAFIAYATQGTIIRNSYVQNTVLDAFEAKKSDGVGGFMGFSHYSSIENSYFTGSVNGIGSSVGGLIGQIFINTSVTNCWVDADILTTGNYAAQIGSFTDRNSNNFRNNVSLGNVNSKYSSASGLRRALAGSSIARGSNNYASENQIILGQVSKEKMDVDFIATERDLESVDYWKNNITIGESFDLSGEKTDLLNKGSKAVTDGYLPMVIGTDGKLVYGQIAYPLSIKLDTVMNQAQLDKNTNVFTINVKVKHPGYDILEGAAMSGAKNITMMNSSRTDFETTFEIKGELTNAWDSYSLTLPVKSQMTGFISKSVIQLKFDSPVYHQIDSRDAWNQYLLTRKDSYENIEIIGDIDFKGSAGEKDIFKVKLNRLRGMNKLDGSKYKIGNINYSLTRNSETIFEVILEVDNIEFNEISYDAVKYDASLSGIIGEIGGSLKNVDFKNINMKFYNGSNLAIIGKFSGALIENVTLEAINISTYDTSVSRVSAFIAQMTKSPTTTNIRMVGEKTVDSNNKESYTNNIIIGGDNSTEISALFGYAASALNFNNIEIAGVKVVGASNVQTLSSTGEGVHTATNIHVKDSHVEATKTIATGISYNTYQVGSSIDNVTVIGITKAYGITQNTASDCTVSNSKIIAKDGDAGGIGVTGNSINNTVVNSEIISENESNGPNAYAGGIRGNRIPSGVQCISKNNKIINSTIRGNGNNVGGLYGNFEEGGTGYENIIYNTVITGHDNVGGLVGNNGIMRSDYSSYIDKTKITGHKYVGSVIGYAKLGIIRDNFIGSGTSVQASIQSAGGLVGYINYVHPEVSSVSQSQMYNNIVGAKVSAPNFAGGMIGIYNVGASTTNWPKNPTGGNIGTPTDGMAPIDYHHNVFTGEVTTSDSFGSFIANSSSKTNVQGMQNVAIYEDSKLVVNNNTLLAKNNSNFEIFDSTGTFDSKIPQVVNTKDMNRKEFYTSEFNTNAALNLWDFENLVDLDLNDLTVVKTKEGIYLKNVGVTGTEKVTLNANEITANTYVTEGLVTWFDGINNQGFNVPHNNEALSWKNLISTQDAILYDVNKPIVTPSKNILFDERSLKFTTNSNNTYARASDIQGLFSKGTSEYTFEFCFESPGYTSSSYGALMSVVLGARSESFNFARGSVNRLFYVGSDNQTSASPVDNNDDFTLSFASNYKTQFAKNKKVYSNGSLIKTFANADGKSDMNVFEIGSSNWNAFANRSFFSIRVYNRSLEESEAAYNAYIDELFYKKYKTMNPASIELDKAVIDNAIFISNEELNQLGDINTLAVEVAGRSMVVDFKELKQPTLDVVDNSNIKINEKTVFNKTTELKAVSATGDVIWYRTNRNYAKIQEVAKVGAGEYARITGYGRYFCEDSSGKRSHIITVDMPKYLPYMKTATSIINGIEGADKVGKLHDQTDKWYEGGYILPGYRKYISTSPLIQGNSGTTRSTGISLDKAEEKFGLKFYASDVDKVNIEFADVSQFSDSDTMIIEQNGVPVFTTLLNETVYSFKYDFKTKIDIKLNIDGKVTNIASNVSEISRDIMTFGDNYYYLHGTGIGSNTGQTEGAYIHLMNGKALSGSGDVFNLTTHSVESNVQGISSIEDVALFNTVYGDQLLETYKNFTKVITQEGVTIVPQLLVAKNNGIHSIMSEDVVVFDSFIKDNRKDEEYFGVLLKSGKWIDILKNMKIPEGVSLSAIENTTYNLYTDSPIMLIRYESKEIKGFNYVTGEEFDLIQPLKIDVDLLTYINNVFEDVFNPSSIYASDFSAAVAFDELIQSNVDAQFELNNYNKEGELLLKVDLNPSDEYKYDKVFGNLTEAQKSETINYISPTSSLIVYNEEKNRFESYSTEEVLTSKSPVPNEEKVTQLKEKGRLINLDRENGEQNDKSINAIRILQYVFVAILILAGYFGVTKLRHRQ